ncbi:MAG: hypothetical protein ACYDH3_01135 [Candidatus Aminicenantales bacterium]
MSKPIYSRPEVYGMIAAGSPNCWSGTGASGKAGVTGPSDS